MNSFVYVTQLDFILYTGGSDIDFDTPSQTDVLQQHIPESTKMSDKPHKIHSDWCLYIDSHTIKQLCALKDICNVTQQAIHLFKNPFWTWKITMHVAYNTHGITPEDLHHSKWCLTQSQTPSWPWLWSPYFQTPAESFTLCETAKGKPREREKKSHHLHLETRNVK